ACARVFSGGLRLPHVIAVRTTDRGPQTSRTVRLQTAEHRRELQSDSLAAARTGHCFTERSMAKLASRRSDRLIGNRDQHEAADLAVVKPRLPEIDKLAILETSRGLKQRVMENNVLPIDLADHAVMFDR